MIVQALAARLRNRLLEERDLLSLWVVLLLAQPLVPLGHPLAEDSLGPWLTLSLCAAAALRGRSTGAGAHPSLTLRRDLAGALGRRAAVAVAPLVVALFYAAAQRRQWELSLAAIALATVAGLLRGIGQRDAQTAWSPPGPALWPVWALVGVSIAAVSTGLGWLLPDGQGWGALAARSAILGVGFLSVGILAGDPLHRRQRAAAGRRDGAPLQRELLPHLLVGLGPAVSWFLVCLLFRWMGELDFGQAHVASLHAVVWAGALWPRPAPTAVTVLLHEVIPSGGADPGGAGAARRFDEPPEGALRFGPLRVRRTRLVRTWVVPVRDARVSGLDDPARPLWSPAPAIPSSHVLGDACFEVDPFTRQPQRARITVHSRLDAARGALSNLEEEHRQFARVVVLRAFGGRGLTSSSKQPMYAWDPRLPEGAVQVLDGQTKNVDLQDGDLVVVSSEGAVYAFEIEIGAPLYGAVWQAAGRMPQLEDYVKAV